MPPFYNHRQESLRNLPYRCWHWQWQHRDSWKNEHDSCKNTAPENHYAALEPGDSDKDETDHPNSKQGLVDTSSAAVGNEFYSNILLIYSWCHANTDPCVDPERPNTDREQNSQPSLGSSMLLFCCNLGYTDEKKRDNPEAKSLIRTCKRLSGVSRYQLHKQTYGSCASMKEHYEPHRYHTPFVCMSLKSPT